MQKSVLFFVGGVLLFSIATGAQAGVRNCTKLLLAADQQERSDLSYVWDLKSPITLGTHQGEKQNLTLSTDSELPNHDSFKLIYLDPKSFAALKSMMKPLSVKELTEELKISEKQLREFALRDGVDRRKQTYRGTDLKAAYLARLAEENYLIGEEEYIDIDSKKVLWIQKILRKRGFPISVHMDGVVEVTHKSWEMIPQRFQKLMLDLHREFKNPQSHLHLGLPSRFVTEEQAWAIARAIETRIVIDFASELDDWGEDLAFNEGSPLTRESSRGNVFLSLNEFETPYPAHNLEIRQHLGIEDGLEKLALGMALATERSRLRIHDQNFGKGLGGTSDFDPRIGNIKGALEYAGQLLSHSNPMDHREIGRRLLKLAHDLPYGRLDSRNVKKVHRFLSENNVPDLLKDPEVYLKH